MDMVTLDVLIMDKQKLFVEGLQKIFEDFVDIKLNVKGVPISKQECLDQLNGHKIDILFLEINLEEIDAMQLIEEIRSEGHKIKICILSSYTNHQFVSTAFKKGADGYMTKHNGSEEITLGIKELIRGNNFVGSNVSITPKISTNGLNGHSDANQDKFILKNKLTEREYEVLTLIIKALSNKEIGKELFISEQTVGVHRKNIRKKLGVKNTATLIKFAMDYGLV